MRFQQLAQAARVAQQRIVDFIEEKRDDFEPFMEDEEKFEHVCGYWLLP